MAGSVRVPCKRPGLQARADMGLAAVPLPVVPALATSCKAH